MKSRIQYSLVFLFLVVGIAFSQAPQAFKYQAVARNSAGMLLNNSNLTVRVGLRDISVTGSIVYQETHAVTTNSFGLLNLNIGMGSVTSGTFTSVNWGSGDKFIEIEIDYGTGFVSMGISQLLSVPYALYAANGPTGPQGLQGIQGIQGLQGLQGIQGIPGANGISINWLGSFTVSPSSPALNNAYYDLMQKKSFVWNGSSWQILAQDGAVGPPGSNIAMPNIQYASGTVTINSNTDLVIVNVPLATTVLNLPACNSVPAGKVIVVIRYNSSSSGGGAQLKVSGTDLIDSYMAVGPVSSVSIFARSSLPNYGVYRLVSDGVSNWYAW